MILFNNKMSELLTRCSLLQTPRFQVITSSSSSTSSSELTITATSTTSVRYHHTSSSEDCKLTNSINKIKYPNMRSLVPPVIIDSTNKMWMAEPKKSTATGTMTTTTRHNVNSSTITTSSSSSTPTSPSTTIRDMMCTVDPLESVLSRCVDNGCAYYSPYTNSNQTKLEGSCSSNLWDQNNMNVHRDGKIEGGIVARMKKEYANTNKDTTTISTIDSGIKANEWKKKFSSRNMTTATSENKAPITINPLATSSIYNRSMLRPTRNTNTNINSNIEVNDTTKGLMDETTSFTANPVVLLHSAGHEDDHEVSHVVVPATGQQQQQQQHNQLPIDHHESKDQHLNVASSSPTSTTAASSTAAAATTTTASKSVDISTISENNVTSSSIPMTTTTQVNDIITTTSSTIEQMSSCNPGNTGNTVLVLISKQSLKLETRIIQEKAISILKLYNINYEIIDGADPNNKEIRNQLFQISNLRGQYPQFFITNTSTNTTRKLNNDDNVLVDNNNLLPTFWGDWDQFDYFNEIGTIYQKLIDCVVPSLESPTTIINDHEINNNNNKDVVTLTLATNENVEPTTISSSSIIPVVDNNNSNSDDDDNNMGTTATTIVTNTSSSPSSVAVLIVLISKQSLKRETSVMQDKAISIIKLHNMNHFIIDGAEPNNKDKRNELFTISTLRGQYPQFFIIYENDNEALPKFWGNYDKFDYCNEIGTIRQELNDCVMISSINDINIKIDNSVVDVTRDIDVSSSAAAAVLLVLISKQSLKRETSVTQEKAISIIRLHDMNHFIIDGADPNNKDKRNELFTISTLRGQYPQFFIIYENDNEALPKFWGDWDKFDYCNEIGTIRQELNDCVTISSTNDINNIKIDNSIVDVKRATDVLLSAATTSQSKVLLMLYSKHSLKREVSANQDRALMILKSRKIDNYETIDGGDICNKELRTELFTLSGIRGEYPQFFILDKLTGITKFWGNYDTFEDSNENGTLDKDLFSE